MMQQPMQSVPQLEIGPLLAHLVETVVSEELEACHKAAAMCAKVANADGRVFVFGAGHAYAFAAELHSRAGGLEMFQPMSLEDLRVAPRHRRHELSDSAPERHADYGPLLLLEHGVTADDALIIASNSGRNAAAVEMALHARREGIPLIAVVSREHSELTESRHHTGKKLTDIADIVLDNHCPLGDALVEVDQGVSICAGSTVAFAALAQLLNEALYRHLDASDRTPRVIRSANVDDSSDEAESDHV